MKVLSLVTTTKTFEGTRALSTGINVIALMNNTSFEYLRLSAQTIRTTVSVFTNLGGF